MQSVLELLSKCEAFFASKGVPNPRLDAQTLLAKAMKCRRLDLFLRFDDPVVGAQLDEFREYVRRRARREPLQHISGSVDFFGLELKCDGRALVPRHETEELCEKAADMLAGNPPTRILDLGTGGGAIILAMKSAFGGSECVAVDADAAALALARENAEKCALEAEFLHGEWFGPVSGKFGLIVSNPPYLTESEVESAEPEVRRFDPPAALSSPDGGLRDLRKIIAEAPAYMEPGALLALECGLGQPETLKGENASNRLYSSIETARDLSGRERFLFMRRA